MIIMDFLGPLKEAVSASSKVLTTIHNIHQTCGLVFSMVTFVHVSDDTTVHRVDY